MIKHIFIIQLGCIFVLVLTSFVEACSSQLQLPLDLSEIAKKYECGAIENFFNRPGMVEPPYAYGYIKGVKENSAVFWCQNKKNNKYKLVVYMKDFKYFQCPTFIENENYPGGLSIIHDPDLSLVNFTYLDNHKNGPNIKSLTDNFIRSYYDGVETIFYCYEGRWLELFRH